MAAVAALTLSSAANATISIGGNNQGTNPYSGPAPTINFDTTFPDSPTAPSPYIVGPGTVSNFFAQPFGSTGQYYAAGPTSNGTGPGSSPGIIDLTSYALAAGAGGVTSLSFLWGSIDAFNTLEFLDSANNVLGGAGFSISGSQIHNPANGDQSDPELNRVVFFILTGTDATNFRKLRLTSTTNAFEIDNIAINPGVPEPATWALMILGFAGIGMALRRRSRPALAQIA
jgi:hypothetical protein